MPAAALNRKTIMIKLPSLTNTASARPAPSMNAQPLLLLLLQAAGFMVAAEARVIAALLPALADDLHSTIAGAGLLITLYALPYGLFQLVYGPLADRFSRQRVLAVALGLFALGTLCSGLAPNMAVLLMLRICTGAAAAGVIPVALAYIGDTVPYAERQAALGRMVGVAAFAGMISAALGGAIAELVSWRVLFIGYGALALLVAAAAAAAAHALRATTWADGGRHAGTIPRDCSAGWATRAARCTGWCCSKGSPPPAHSATWARCWSRAIICRTASAARCSRSTASGCCWRRARPAGWWRGWAKCAWSGWAAR